MALSMLRNPNAVRAAASSCRSCNRLMASSARPYVAAPRPRAALMRVRSEAADASRELAPWAGRSYGALAPFWRQGFGSLMTDLQREMDTLMDRSFPQDLTRPLKGMKLSVDLTEDKDAYYIQADTPGIPKENIKIQLQPGNVLLIEGERTMEKNEESEDKNVRRVERVYGQFSRRFQLPKSVDLKGIKANSEDGVLKITVPKLEKEDPEVTEIPVM